MKKKIFIFALCGFLILLLTGCGKSTANSNQSGGNSANNFDATKVEKNISISEETIISNNSLVAIIKNGNDESINIEVEAVFYDADGNPLGSNSAYLSIYNKQQMACNFYDIPSGYSDYEISIKATKPIYTNYSNKIDVTSNDTGEQIVVQVTNNSSDTIDNIDIATVFYKNGKIVGYENGYDSDLKSDATSTSNIYYPYDANFENVSFDKYKVYVSAYSYNY